jgi:hypothetical protein
MPHQSATADYALTELPHLGADSATYAVGHLVSAQPGPHLTDLFRSGLLEDIKSEPSGHGSPDNQVVLPRDEGLAVFAAEHPRLFAPQNVPERESHEESYGTCLSLSLSLLSFRQGSSNFLLSPFHRESRDSCRAVDRGRRRARWEGDYGGGGER